MHQFSKTFSFPSLGLAQAFEDCLKEVPEVECFRHEETCEVLSTTEPALRQCLLIGASMVKGWDVAAEELFGTTVH